MEIIAAAYGIMEVRLIGGGIPRVRLLTRVCSPTERVSCFIGGTLSVSAEQAQHPLPSFDAGRPRNLTPASC